MYKRKAGGQSESTLGPVPTPHLVYEQTDFGLSLPICYKMSYDYIYLPDYSRFSTGQLPTETRFNVYKFLNNQYCI